jgi:hypothetical protein
MEQRLLVSQCACRLFTTVVQYLIFWFWIRSDLGSLLVTGGTRLLPVQQVTDQRTVCSVGCSCKLVFLLVYWTRPLICIVHIVSSSHCKIAHDELVRTWKEVFVLYFKVVSWFLPIGTEQKNTTLSQNIGPLGLEYILLCTSWGVLTTQLQRLFS